MFGLSNRGQRSHKSRAHIVSWIGGLARSEIAFDILGVQEGLARKQANRISNHGIERGRGPWTYFLRALRIWRIRADDNARHDLLELLVIALCAVLCGAEDCSDMALFGRAKEAFFREFLTLRHGGSRQFGRRFGWRGHPSPPCRLVRHPRLRAVSNRVKRSFQCLPCARRWPG